MSFEMIVVICIAVVYIVDKIIWYKKEVDLIDRALPRDKDDRRVQLIKQTIRAYSKAYTSAKDKKPEDELPPAKDSPTPF